MNEEELERNLAGRSLLVPEVGTERPGDSPEAGDKSGNEINPPSTSNTDWRTASEPRQLAEDLDGWALFLALGIYFLSAAISLLVIILIVRAIHS